jgi:hypothetical protein
MFDYNIIVSMLSRKKSRKEEKNEDKGLFLCEYGENDAC